MQTITDYFEEIRISLSNALSDGGRVDRSQLDAAARAFDELTDFEEDDIRDLEDLNKRLGPA